MAKILICSYSGYGFWFSLRLQEEGHSVDIYLDTKENPAYKYVLGGIIQPPSFAKPDFKKYDLVLFDLTGRPKLAEEAMQSTPTIGDGDFNSEIEDDRLLGIEMMEQCGIGVPFYEVFDDIGAAKKFIKKTNKRFVFKPNGGQKQDTATTYVSKNAEDLLRYLDRLGTTTKGAEFILQEVVTGTEISTEAYFNGEEFFLINATLEEKKLMNENLGPNTGCSGNLVWVYDQQNPPFVFREGLGKMKEMLQGMNYRGMIDLNTIVSDTKLYGLEWTPRFGYDASATLFSCLDSNLGDFFGAVATGSVPEYNVANNFAVGIRLSIPPYPSEIEDHHPEDIPIEGLEEDDFTKNFFAYDCACVGDSSFVTVGVNGLIGVPIQCGGRPDEAFSRVSEKIKKINVPDMQYRTDLEDRIMKRYITLQRQGWLR